MLDLSKYQSIGAALKDALDHFADEVCLIEADREREKERLTYRDFKERAHPLAKALQDGGFFAGDSRQHHHDQSVEMADFGVRDFFRWWRSRSAGLQAHARRAVAIAQTFERIPAGHGISDLAATQCLGWTCGCDQRSDRVGHRSTYKRRSLRCAALGRIPRSGRAGFRPS